MLVSVSLILGAQEPLIHFGTALRESVGRYCVEMYALENGLPRLIGAAFLLLRPQTPLPATPLEATNRKHPSNPEKQICTFKDSLGDLIRGSLEVH